MTTDLREELHALAETQTFAPDPSAWDRGRRARRRSRVVRAAAAVAVVAAVVGVGTIAVQPGREAPQPAGEVPGGAIPRVVPRAAGSPLTDLAIGRASVAYVDGSAQPVLVDATTGEAHRVALPDFPGADVLDLATDVRNGPWLALSPDGTRLAYPTVSSLELEPGELTFQTAWYRTVDLTTGTSELVDLPECGATPRAMTWTSDGLIAVDVMGRPTLEEPDVGMVSCTVDPTTGDSGTKALLGVTAPGGGISATFPVSDATFDDPPVDTTDDPVDAVSFVTSSGTDPSRELPADRYPDGAAVSPIGWADNSLLVAQVGTDIVLLTSPDRPDAEWVWRTLVTDLPDAESVTVAVDLVPDLTGDPDQELTHDFTAEAEQPRGDTTGVVSFLVSAGFFVLLGVGIAVVALIRMVRSRA